MLLSNALKFGKRERIHGKGNSGALNHPHAVWRVIETAQIACCMSAVYVGHQDLRELLKNETLSFGANELKFVYTVLDYYKEGYTGFVSVSCYLSTDITF